MNTHAVMSPDGLSRRRFTISDVERMVEVGIIAPDERLEILDGEILAMAPKGPLHEILKRHFNRHLALHLPEPFGHIQEGGWRLGERLYLEPDFLVFPTAREIVGLAGSDALLVIELAHTSLDYDLGRKAAAYARLGVPEYWVVDVTDRSTRVHRAPDDSAFGAVTVVEARSALEPVLVPGYSVRLADLPGA